MKENFCLNFSLKGCPEGLWVCYLVPKQYTWKGGKSEIKYIDHSLVCGPRSESLCHAKYDNCIYIAEKSNRVHLSYSRIISLI